MCYEDAARKLVPWNLVVTDLETEPVSVLALEGVKCGAPLGELEFPRLVVRVQPARCHDTSTKF